MPSVFPPGARLGLRYRIARVVAHGPSAALYEAHHLDSGDVVAFKWLHAPDGQRGTLSRLADRAREVQQLHDPGLVDVLDVAREHDSLFVVSRWERGEPYSHLLAHHLMPRSQRLAVLGAALSALESGHRAGVAHGGLHPDNLYLGSRSGTALKLLDLALNQTCCAAMFGTPQRVSAGHHVYMAPEQLEPRYLPNLRSDVFAAGVLAFHALSGRLPFDAPDVAGLRAAHAHEPPRIDTLRAEVPSALAKVLAASLATRPERRPSSLAELRGELDNFAREVVSSATELVDSGPLSMSVTQSQARGELILTPKDAARDAETESVSQPISFHGEQRVEVRYRGFVALALVLVGLMVGAVAMLPRPRPVTRPPALPSVELAPPAWEPTKPDAPGKPDAAKPHKRRHRARRPQEEAPAFRSGRPLSRDDF